ncbi:hypothetical protein D9611_000591 [Ephemerocybe angulata]|uniref:Uncharacterized protein n=1 Tax=Ephemerocybe angulata TaxID=980116 RepID=A0A8H5BM55_9AGAR|nr:hypothetical protein D9611_000591 [Tulosesus angulatus]
MSKSPAELMEISRQWSAAGADSHVFADTFSGGSVHLNPIAGATVTEIGMAPPSKALLLELLETYADTPEHAKNFITHCKMIMANSSSAGSSSGGRTLGDMGASGAGNIMTVEDMQRAQPDREKWAQAAMMRASPSTSRSRAR